MESRLRDFTLQTLKLKLMLADVFLHRRNKQLRHFFGQSRHLVAPAILGVQLLLSLLRRQLLAAARCSPRAAWQRWPDKKVTVKHAKDIIDDTDAILQSRDERFEAGVARLQAHARCLQAFPFDGECQEVPLQSERLRMNAAVSTLEYWLEVALICAARHLAIPAICETNTRVNAGVLNSHFEVKYGCIFVLNLRLQLACSHLSVLFVKSYLLLKQSVHLF